MSSNNGGTALQSAVPTFVGDFNNSTIGVSMVSFASNATINVPIGYNFKTAITTSVGGMKFSGGTFGTGAGTGSLQSSTMGPPLSLAQTQVDSVSTSPGENIVKVVVYFTDGLMNTIQDTFNCPSSTLLNYGGHDSGSTVDIFDPIAGTDWGSYSSTTGLPYDASAHICKDSTQQKVTTFPSQQSGTREVSEPIKHHGRSQVPRHSNRHCNANGKSDPCLYLYNRARKRHKFKHPGLPGTTRKRSIVYINLLSPDSRPGCSSIYRTARPRPAQLRFRRHFRQLQRRSCCALRSSLRYFNTPHSYLLPGAFQEP